MLVSCLRITFTDTIQRKFMLVTCKDCPCLQLHAQSFVEPT